MKRDGRRDKKLTPDEASPTDPTETAPKKAEANHLISVSPTWAFGLTIAACAVGFTLLVIGLWGEITISLDGILSTTFIVSGLALIFGAFGSQATVQYKGWVIAGVAGIALVFLYVINSLRTDAYVVIDLISSKLPTTIIKAERVRIKGSVESEDNHLQTTFHLRYGELQNADMLTFHVEMPLPGNQIDRHRICFSRSKITSWFGRRSHLSWKLNEETWEIHDRAQLIGSPGHCEIRSLRSEIKLPDLIVSSANAQASSKIELLIQDLLSDNPDVRSLSPDRLADFGPEIVRPLMDQARRMSELNDPLALRMQIGTAAALESLLTKISKLGSASKRLPAYDGIKAQLNEADFKLLLMWFFSDHRELNFATSLVLGSTAELPILRALVRETEKRLDDRLLSRRGDRFGIVYNTALTLKLGAYQYSRGLDPVAFAETKQLARQLKSRELGKETDTVLNEIIAMR